MKIVICGWRRTLVLNLILFAGFQNAAWCDELTLQQAIKVALENNYSILLTNNDAEIAANNASIGNAGFLPSVDVTANANKTIFDTRQEFASGGTSEMDGARTTTLQGAVNLNWTLFDGFAMFTSMKQLNALKETGELAAQAQVEITIADVIAAYNNILQQRQLLRALSDAIIISRERSQIAEGKFRIGSGSRLEWNRARVDLIADSSAYLRQETVWTNSKYELNRLLSRPTDTAFETADTIRIRSDLVLSDLNTTSRMDNKDILLAERSRRLAKLRLSEVRAERLPAVNLNLGYDLSRTESNAGFFLFNRNRRFNYGVSLQWNLFNGFNTTREEQNAKVDIRSSEIAMRETELSIETELAKVYKEYQASLRIVQLEAENEQLARQNVDIALEQFRLGAITSVDLREVQNNFVDSETRFLAAQLQAKLAETELLRLSGQLVKN